MRIAEIALAPGQAGYYDKLSNTRLTVTKPKKVILAGTNVSNLIDAVKEKKILLLWGSLYTHQITNLAVPSARGVSVIPENSSTGGEEEGGGEGGGGSTPTPEPEPTEPEEGAGQDQTGQSEGQDSQESQSQTDETNQTQGVSNDEEQQQENAAESQTNSVEVQEKEEEQEATEESTAAASVLSVSADPVELSTTKRRRSKKSDTNAAE